MQEIGITCLTDVWLCLTDDLKEELDIYIQQHLQKKVKLVRNEKREGLIRGRMIGASHATGLTMHHCKRIDPNKENTFRQHISLFSKEESLFSAEEEFK